MMLLVLIWYCWYYFDTIGITVCSKVSTSMERFNQCPHLPVFIMYESTVNAPLFSLNISIRKLYINIKSFQRNCHCYIWQLYVQFALQKLICEEKGRRDGCGGRRSEDMWNEGGCTDVAVGEGQTAVADVQWFITIKVYCVLM